MISGVEGDWKGVVFKIALEADISDINAHVRENFLLDEAWNKNLGWCEEKAKDYDKIAEILVNDHNISLIARDKATGEIAAVQLVTDSRKQNERLKTAVQNMSPLGQTIMKLIENIEDSTDELFREQFPCSFYADIMISSVGKKSRGVGLGLEIYRRSLELLKLNGFPVVRSTFTSPGTRAIGEKLGFTILGTFYLKSHLDETGQRIFPSCGDDEYAVDVAKRLN